MGWLDIFGVFRASWYGLHAVIMQLDIFIYGAISSLFKIFMALAGAKLLTNDAFMTIANKLYMIIGVVMLFVLSYGLVRAIINPDEAVKGEMGGPKIVKAIIIAVVGLAVTPVVFDLMYKGQSVFLENDVLAAIFFRSDLDSYDLKTITIQNVSSNTDTGSATNANSDGLQVEVGNVEYNKEIKNLGGSVTATSLWQAFFRPHPAVFKENYSESAELVKGDVSHFYFKSAGAWAIGCAAGVGLALAVIFGVVTFGLGIGIGAAAGVAACGIALGDTANGFEYKDNMITLDQAYKASAATGDFDMYFVFLPNIVSDDNVAYNGEKVNDVSYVWGFSTLVGLFVCYCFLTFSIDLAIRAAKLAYYQIIAPIPLILQIIPKFQKTWKDYISSVINTFLEVFIRISVIYIITYFICHLDDVFNFGDSLNGVNLDPIEWLLASVIMILGLVAFARNAPKLISETFGLKAGSLDFGIRKKLADGGLFSAGAIAGSLVTGAVRNATNTWRESREAGVRGLRRVGQTARSAIGGAGSAAARTTYSQFFAPNHHEAHDFREMRDSASRAAEDASNARIRRRGRRDDINQTFQRNMSASHIQEVGQNAYDNYLKRHPGDTTGATNARTRAERRASNSFVGRAAANWSVRTQGIRDSFEAWRGGTVDTSEWDNLMSLESKLEGARNKIVDTVSGKDNSYKDALKLEEELRTPEKRREIAYEIEARRKALIRAFKTSSDATERAIADAAERHDFDALINRYHVFDGKSENFTAAFKSNTSLNGHLDAIKTKGDVDFISFADFNVGDETELGNITRSVLRAKREAAGLGVKNAQAEVAARYTASYALFGVGNDVTDEANRIFNELQAELRKNRNATFKGVPLEQYIRENFGEDALATGTIDYDNVLSKTIGEFKFDAKGNSGNYTITYTNTKNSSGGIDTNIEIRDENNNVVPGTAGFDLQHLKEFLKSDNASQQGQGSSNVTNSGAFTQMKSDATDARRDLFDDPAYKDARTRQQRQRERQQNNNNNGGH